MDLNRFNTVAESPGDLIAQIMPGDRVFTARDTEFFRPSLIEVENVKTVSKTMFTTTAGNSYMRRTGIKRGEGEFQVPRYVTTFRAVRDRRRTVSPWDLEDTFSKNALAALDAFAAETPEARHSRENTRKAAYLDSLESWHYVLTDQEVTRDDFTFLTWCVDHVAGDPEGHRRVYYLGEDNIQTIRDILAARRGPVRCGYCGLPVCIYDGNGRPILAGCATAPRVDEESGRRILDAFQDAHGITFHALNLGR